MTANPLLTTSTSKTEDVGSQRNAIPSQNNTRDESIGLKLDQLAPSKIKDSPTKGSLSDGFEFAKAEGKAGELGDMPTMKNLKKVKRKPKKVVKPKEIPSLDDIKLLQEHKKQSANKTKPIKHVIVKPIKIAQPNITKQENLLKLHRNDTPKRPKQEKIGNLSNEELKVPVSHNTKLGDLGSLGDSRAAPVVSKNSSVEEAAWKRKLANLGELLSSGPPKDPETPSVSDLGEIATYKKEMAAAIKGLGPDANLMSKKSRVPKKPRRRFWGINAVENDAADEESNEAEGGIRKLKHNYWGINAASENYHHKDEVPSRQGE